MADDGTCSSAGEEALATYGQSLLKRSAADRKAKSVALARLRRSEFYRNSAAQEQAAMEEAKIDALAQKRFGLKISGMLGVTFEGNKWKQI